ncbi:3-hydroxyacyl-CoA dehydrogenase family protein [Paenibacillus beijingensis]|uniref:3-hydroxybutyryl-CoA dehydrogenase n=1 Tax=Paenibacillus beijingensis TaxID=1126833 RepID=A0A0D5NP71_9BACL|nr:3-hydroxyacyl-CoA dehydrogenase NAD-binding domain-containing protein [Paenibacillus beijingensis]AJY76802.1 hypothetical protein VN24_22330 [Paenibacillus beijingensis]
MGENAINKVAIIGAGVQGSMLIFRSAIYNKEVYVFDQKQELIEHAVQKVGGWVDTYIERGRLTQNQADAALQRINIAESLEQAVKQADIVIETVPENIELKTKVWTAIDSLAPAKALLTSNSSSIRSSQINVNTTRKDRTFSVNFVVPIQDDLVEVMWNSDTSEETKDAALRFLNSQNHLPIVTKHEINGFSLNRVWRAIKKECLFLWSNGYIDPEDLDRAFMLEWRTSIGPFGIMDKVGLDVVRDIELRYYYETGDASDQPHQALNEMVERGHLGEKSGKGFYQYPDPAYANPEWLDNKQDKSVNQYQS